MNRALIEASTPKCPGKNYRGPPCGRMLRWAQLDKTWSCKVHGKVLTGEAAALRPEEEPLRMPGRLQ